MFYCTPISTFGRNMTSPGIKVQMSRARIRTTTMGQIALLICYRERPLIALATKMSMAMGGVVMPIARPMVIMTPK